jgi:hypothetical protein
MRTMAPDRPQNSTLRRNRGSVSARKNVDSRFRGNDRQRTMFDGFCLPPSAFCLLLSAYSFLTPDFWLLTPGF